MMISANHHPYKHVISFEPVPKTGKLPHNYRVRFEKGKTHLVSEGKIIHTVHHEGKEVVETVRHDDKRFEALLSGSVLLASYDEQHKVTLIEKA